MTWGVGARPRQPERPAVHRVIMSFHYSNGWRITFFNDDRRRSALPRRAFCHDDETLLNFIRRAGGVKGSDMHVYLEASLKRQHGEVTLHLTEEQYDVLLMRRRDDSHWHR